jgi:hypothetical protein
MKDAYGCLAAGRKAGNGLLKEIVIQCMGRLHRNNKVLQHSLGNNKCQPLSSQQSKEHLAPSLFDSLKISLRLELHGMAITRLFASLQEIIENTPCTI